MTKKTRDNIYEYIFLTDLEASVARHPLFLRLHYVHQNSFTFLTYPTAHMQRHPHSLGVMHVAGKLLSHSVANTLDANVLRTLRSDIVYECSTFKDKIGLDEVHEEFSQTQGELFSSEAVFSELVGADHFLQYSEKDAKEHIELCLLYQAVRLAALVHDIGHPPFSHIVEYGFQSALGEDYHHEKVGYDLSRLVFADINEPSSKYHRGVVQKFPKFCNCACHLALRISSEPTSRLRQIKKSILAGDMDADRLDYVRRDIESTALTATSYDLGRILDSVHFRFSRADDHGDDCVESGLSPGALSAIETFFVARSHLYRWAIYHHDVARRNLCMHRFVHSFITTKELPANLVAIRDDFVSIANSPDRRTDYKYFVDGYFFKILWEVYDTLSQLAGTIHPTLQDLHLFCDLILTRNNERLKSLWKRPDDYARFARSYYSGSKDSGAELVEKLNLEFRSVFDEKYQPVFGEKLGRFKFAQELEEMLSGELEGDVGKLFVYYNAPFKAAPKSMELSDPRNSDMGQRIPVDDISPSIASLRTAWEKSPQLLVYYRVTEGNRNLDAKTLHSLYNKAMRTALEKMRDPNFTVSVS